MNATTAATEVVLDNGDRYLIDPDRRLIAPSDPTPEPSIRNVIAATACDLMVTGQPVGPQVDEYRGLVGDWNAAHAGRAAFAALLDAASFFGRSVMDTRPV